LTSEEPFQSPQQIRLGEAPIISVSMSASPNRLVAVNDRGAVYLASANNPDASSDRLPVTGPVARQNGAVISRDGRWLATRGDDSGDVELWRMDQGGIHGDARVQSWAFYMIFTGDSRWLVTVNEQEALRWNLADFDALNEPVKLMDLPLQASPMVAISPDRRWMSHGAFGPDAGGYRGEVRLGNLSENVPATRTLLVRVEQRPLDLALGVEGQWFAATSGVGAVNLWKCGATVALDLPYKLRGDNRRITAMAFSPDRQWFVTADEGGVVRIWDLKSADPSQAAVALRGHSSDVTSIVISPDGRWLFAAATDGAYRAWRLQRDELLQLARQAAGRDLTAEEYDQYVAPTNGASR
jgi:WD40 repeat protein